MISEKNCKIAIAGGSGFLGKSLADFFLGKGWTVAIISRGKIEPPGGRDGLELHRWDGRSRGGWEEALKGAKAVINLTGRSVDCVKTPDNCDEILRSRVESTHVIGKVLQHLERPPECWVQMSTAHCYGDPPSLLCTESSAMGYGLAPFVAKAWEREHHSQCPKNVRSVVLRTSFVLGADGGALIKLARLTKLGLGGKVGNGKQGVSWIHIEDMNRLIFSAVEDSEMSGTYLATAPNPVPNSLFMKELRRALGVPFGLPAPSLCVRVVAPLLMRTDPDLALYGRYCVSERLPEKYFRFPRLREALEDIFQKRR